MLGLRFAVLVLSLVDVNLKPVYAQVALPAPPSWPVEKGQPERLRLGTYHNDRGFLSLGSPPDFADVAVYEYSDEESTSVDTAINVTTTGRSLHFRFPSEVVTNDFSKGSGPKIKITTTLYFDGSTVRYPFLKNDRLDATKDELWRNGVLVSIESAHVGQQRIDALNPEPGGLWYEHIAAALAGRISPQDTRFSARPTDHSYCGYRVLQSDRYIRSNPLMIAAQKPPIAWGDLFVAVGRDDPYRVLKCEYISDDNAACRVKYRFNDWTTVKLVFHHSHICDVDKMMSATNRWLIDQISLETR